MSSVPLILITHDLIGKALKETAEETFGHLPLPTFVLSVFHRDDISLTTGKLQQLVNQLSSASGILVLTDLAGSTPTNLLKKVRASCEIKVVSGLNLPMLIRVFNYANLSLTPLLHKAVSGGRDGILICE